LTLNSFTTHFLSSEKVHDAKSTALVDMARGMPHLFFKPGCTFPTTSPRALKKSTDARGRELKICPRL
jgi:hypothetical protein